MGARLRAAWAWLTSAHWMTWLGHGVWGFVAEWTLGWLHWSYALLTLAVGFAFRETEDALRHAAEDEEKLGSFWRALKRTIRDDGAMDFFSPLMGWVLGLWLKQVLGIHHQLLDIVARIGSGS